MFVGAREKADAIVIHTSEDHDDIGAERRRYQVGLKFVHAFYERTRKPILEALSSHRTMERDDCSPGEYYVSRVGQKILAFQVEQDRIAEAKRKVADDKARAKAQREQDERVEEMRRTAEAAPTKTLTKQIDRQATALSKQPVQATAAVEIDPGYRRVPGTSRREPWTGRVTDLKKAFALLAAGDLPANLVEFRQSELNKLAGQYREQLKVMFPGLDASSEKKLAG